ncbi:hypothetical protein JCM5350_006471 [Sporobolomyces pararoseus]
MSSRASPIPTEAFDRPSSPSPSIRSNSSQTSSSFSPFQPVVLPSSFTARPIVYRPGGKPSLPTRMPGEMMQFGERGKEEDDAWETASVSSWGGGDTAGEGRAFHPRLRDLRQPRPNVRKPELRDSEERKEKTEAPREVASGEVEGQTDRKTEAEACESSAESRGREGSNEKTLEKTLERKSSIQSSATKATQDEKRSMVIGETEKTTEIEEPTTPSNQDTMPTENGK